MDRAGVKGAWCALAFVLASTPSVRALDADFLTADDLTVGGYADFGRFQLNDDDVKGFDGEIVSRVGARWSIDKPIDDNFSAMVKLHWMFWRNQATDISLFHIAGLKFDADMQAALTWASSASERGQLVRFGLYDFKYNPDSRNLGEYLLRSEAYPTILESSQGKDLLADSHNRIAGVQYARQESHIFRHTTLLYAEMFSQPVYDLTLAYISTFGTEKMNVGLGVAWARFVKLSSEDSNTTLPADRHEYIKNSGLTTEALKFSLRARAEIVSLPRNERLVLYGEAALLGIDSDTLYYDNFMERVPVMVGVSLPTAGLLTSLSVEVEYLKNPYGDRRYEVRYAPTPLPVLDDYSEKPNYTKDDVRWSVQAHKSLNKWLDFKVRVASDHLRLRSWDGDYDVTSPMTKTTRDWYFLARLEFHN
jgi:hypothetical protein